MLRSLFLLPQEVTPFGLKGRLGALNYQRAVDLNTNADLQSLYCQLPERFLPHPRYCFLNALNPFLCKKAFLESQFYDACQELIHNCDLNITWSARPLKTFLPTRLRLCKEEPFYADTVALLDICTLLHAINIFDDAKLKVQQGLLVTAKNLGFKGDLDKHKLISKMNALIFLSHKALEISPKLFSFMAKTFSEQTKSLKKSIFDKKPQILVDRLGSLNLILPLELVGFKLKIIKLAEEDCFIDEIDLCDRPLIAPYTVLTAKRQQSLNFDLNKALLSISEAYEHLNDLYVKKTFNLEESFFKKLNRYDLKLYHTLSRSGFNVAPIPQASDFFKNWILLCRGDNFRTELIDTEYQHYIELSKNSLKQQVDSYSQEIEALAQIIDENNADDLHLAQALIQYPKSLDY